jgi:hypothetical protein
VAADASEQIGSLKLNQIIDLRLKIPGLEETLPFKVRLVRLKAPRYAGFVFENVSFDNRLALEQVTKDLIVTESFKSIPVAQLPASLQCDLWLHGAFDTNVMLWFENDRLSVKKALVESDNLIWMYDAGQIFLQKSFPTSEENQSYFKAEELFTKTATKVSMGASWMDRLIRVLDQANERRGGDLAGLLILLRSQRAH